MIKEEKKCETSTNDDRLNVHNINLLMMLHANVDCQPVLSRYAVLKYIAKYASKAKKGSESYHHMLTRISNSIGSQDHALCAYRKFLAETIVDRETGAQETCHMLLKLPLVICGQKFVSLNVGRFFFRKISRDSLQCSFENTFFQHYQKRPFFLEHLSLIETTRSWTFDSKHKQDPWKPRDVHAIFRVLPRFYSIPGEDLEDFETFCWT